jgi:hypothetical protein
MYFSFSAFLRKRGLAPFPYFYKGFGLNFPTARESTLYKCRMLRCDPFPLLFFFLQPDVEIIMIEDGIEHEHIVSMT